VNEREGSIKLCKDKVISSALSFTKLTNSDCIDQDLLHTFEDCSDDCNDDDANSIRTILMLMRMIMLLIADDDDDCHSHSRKYNMGKQEGGKKNCKSILTLT